MRYRILSGLTIIIIGLIIAIGPFTFFHVCRPADHDMIMACGYTARAELGIGISTALIAFISVFVRSDAARVGYFASTAVLSVFAFIVPSILIGVCEGAHMHCRAAALPSLLIFSTVLFFASAAFAFGSYRKGGESNA